VPMTGSTASSATSVMPYRRRNADVADARSSAVPAVVG